MELKNIYHYKYNYFTQARKSKVMKSRFMNTIIMSAVLMSAIFMKFTKFLGTVQEATYYYYKMELKLNYWLYYLY